MDHGMSMEDWLRGHGLEVDPSRLSEVRALLAAESAKEARAQGKGDTELMRLCCAQLFRAGLPEDALCIWAAKSASMDANSSIDVQLLCGAGLEPTRAFLARQRSRGARAALAYLEECEQSGDFRGFSVADYAERLAAYYALG
jgi:hypothetical protein